MSQLSRTICRLLLTCALASVSGSATANLIVDYQVGSIFEPVQRLAEFRDDGTFVRELATGLPLGSNTHLAEVGSLIYRSSSLTNAPIHVIDRNGNLVRTVFNDAVSSSSTAVRGMTTDFDGTSVFFADAFAGTNVLHHLDDPVSGASSLFTNTFYSGELGRAATGHTPQGDFVFELHFVHPDIGPDRIDVTDVNGDRTRNITNASLDVPYANGDGDLVVDPSTGNVFVATSQDILVFDPGSALISQFSYAHAYPRLEFTPGGRLVAASVNDGAITFYSQSGTLLDSWSLGADARVRDVIYVNAVPEPSTIILAAVGCVVLLACRRRRHAE